MSTNCILALARSFLPIGPGFLPVRQAGLPAVEMTVRGRLSGFRLPYPVISTTERPVPGGRGEISERFAVTVVLAGASSFSPGRSGISPCGRNDDEG